MFSWSALPESLDNNCDDHESTILASSSSSSLPQRPSTAAPTSATPASSTPHSSPPQPQLPSNSPPAHMLTLPRSASTSQIDTASPTSHFETTHAAPYPLSTGSRPNQRSIPGGLITSHSETTSSAHNSSKQIPTSKLGTTLDSISSGLKPPHNNNNNSPVENSSSSSTGLGFRGQQQHYGLSLDPPSGAWWYSKKSADLPDFVLISEFSEVEGPRAVMTIPDNIVDLTRDSYSSSKQQRAQDSPVSPKHSQDPSDASTSTLAPESNGIQENTCDLFDIHEFVLRITSVDQQVRETSGAFHIPEDIEVHINDVEKGYWAYVHHFTLFDINARGFVRPFYMSYITRDPRKILAHYNDLRHKFSKAALYFKAGNYTLFRQDLTKKLRDLNYTNNLLSEAPSSPPPSQSESNQSTFSSATANSYSTDNTTTTTTAAMTNTHTESSTGPQNPRSSSSSPPPQLPSKNVNTSSPSQTSEGILALRLSQSSSVSEGTEKEEGGTKEKKQDDEKQVIQEQEQRQEQEQEQKQEVESAERSQQDSLSEQQKSDLESIKDAIETATHIISVLEHYSVDGQPLLGHPDDGHEALPSMVPLSDLSPMTSSENLAMLAAGRSNGAAGATGTGIAGVAGTAGAVGAVGADSSLFLGAPSRPSSRIRRKASTPNVSGSTSSRILDSTGMLSMTEGLAASPIPPHLLGLQQDQSRKNSVVSDYESMMNEMPEYEAQYATSLYPAYRDEVVFRPLRELCIANMVWNSSIQFHLGIKKIKDILKEFQVDYQLLGDMMDCIKRMHPTSSGLTIGQRFMINFRNPDFNRITTRTTQLQETSAPLIELIHGMSITSVPSEDRPSTQEINTVKNQEPLPTVVLDETAVEERRDGQVMDAEDADDEQTGYDSLDDAESFFTAATGVATQTDTPTRDAFVIAPLDRSARVVEWHQEQQNLHHAKGSTNLAAATQQTPWSFGTGLHQGDHLLASGNSLHRMQNRHPAQSANVGMMATGPVQTACSPTIVLDTLQKDPVAAKDLVFALLSGRKVCIMGQSDSEAKVRKLVSVLATFLPHAGYPSREEQLIEHQRQIMTWHQGPGLLQLSDMEKLCLVGVDSSKIDPKFLGSGICILNYDTMAWINAQHYTDGVFLEAMFKDMDIFSEDTSFLAYVDGKLYEILLKSFLYYHLVFNNRLYQGGFLAQSGAQTFYSSGASDDGEAFSSQNNFRSSRQSLATTPKGDGSSRTSRVPRRNTSAYPSSTQLGTTVSHKMKTSRAASLSSQVSSDAEKLQPIEQYDSRKEDFSEKSRCYQSQHYDSKSLGRLVMSGDESSQGDNGTGTIQFTTSQGMKKWKKWFEYWSAKSAAMIDPALAAFGRSDSNTIIDGISHNGSGNRRKRNSNGRASPHRRSKTLPIHHHHHTSPGRHREVKEREKERGRERERERNQKLKLDHFDVGKGNPMLLSTVSDNSTSSTNTGGSDSDSYTNDNKNDFAAFEEETIMGEKSRMEYSGDRDEDLDHPKSVGKIEESHSHLAEALGTSSKGLSGLRRLRPKRPLLLSRATSKSSDLERDKNEHREDATTVAGGGESLKKASSLSGSPASPSTSATFRSFAGAFRAMSFGSSTQSSAATGILEAGTHLEASAKDSNSRQSSEIQRSPRNSRELSDPGHLNKEIRRHGSTRAKAKAWLKSKRKKRGRVSEGDQLQQLSRGAEELNEEGSEDDGGDSELREMQESRDKESPGLERHSEHQSSREQDLGQGEQGDAQPHTVEDSELTIRTIPRSAPASTLTSSKLPIVPPQQSRSTEDLTESVRAQHHSVTELPLDTPLTIQEIAALEPTRIQPPRAIPSPPLTVQSSVTPSLLPTLPVTSTSSPTLSSNGNNNRSRASSVNASRSTSLNVISFAPGHRQSVSGLRPSISLKGSATVPGLVSAAAAQRLVSAMTDGRSEIDDGEYDPRRDPGRESATDYETSLETLTGLESGNVSSIGRAEGKRQSAESFGWGSLNTVATPSTAASITPTMTTTDVGLGMNLKGSQQNEHQPQPRRQQHQEEGQGSSADDPKVSNRQQSQQQQQQQQQRDEDKVMKDMTDMSTVTLTEEEEVIVREMLGGITGMDDWAIIVYLATMVDMYERSKAPTSPISNEL